MVGAAVKGFAVEVYGIESPTRLLVLSKHAPQAKAAASPGNLLEMQSPESHPRLTESGSAF